MQFLNLYPTKIGFLIGITNGLCGIGSFFPLAWNILIEYKFMSYSAIMWTWFGFSIVSLFLGIFIYPWNNLPQDLPKGRSLIWDFRMYMSHVQYCEILNSTIKSLLSWWAIIRYSLWYTEKIFDKQQRRNVINKNFQKYVFNFSKVEKIRKVSQIADIWRSSDHICHWKLHCQSFIKYCEWFDMSWN